MLDTNHLSHAIRKVSTLRDRIRTAVRHGDQLGTCWPALCELEVGIRQTADPEAIRRTLNIVLNLSNSQEKGQQFLRVVANRDNGVEIS